MTKRKPLGQDPLAWIRKTAEEESPPVVASESASAPEADDRAEGPAVSLATRVDQGRSAPNWHFLLVVTVDFLLLILLGFLGFTLLSSRLDRLAARVSRLEAQVAPVRPGGSP